MKIGTSTWVITSSSDHRYHLLGYNLTLGASETQCSHVNELSGLLGVLEHWIGIGNKYDLLDTPITFKCDGLEEVKADKRINYTPSLNIAHFDLIWTFHRMIKSLPIPPKFIHVKGHQDALGHVLDLWDDMNAFADL